VIETRGELSISAAREGLVHEAGFLTAADGTRLFCQELSPHGPVAAWVALVHGYNSFSDWLMPMMAAFARKGLACCAIDYRGHGLSEGVPNHVFRFQEYLEDAEALCRHTVERAGQQPVFLFGNSLGGLIASHYAVSHPERLRGLALTAPFFGPAFRVPRVMDLCARAASYCRPTLCIPKQHPEMPERMTFRWWTETLRAQQWLWRRANHITSPVLLLHGERDIAACPRTARLMLRRFASQDRTFRRLPGATHQDLDPCAGEAWWSEVAGWMLERTDTERSFGQKHLAS
jgi:lysophospholipase